MNYYTLDTNSQIWLWGLFANIQAQKSCTSFQEHSPSITKLKQIKIGKKMQSISDE